jgi:hypothetical protein
MGLLGQWGFALKHDTCFDDGSHRSSERGPVKWPGLLNYFQKTGCCVKYQSPS